MLFVCFPIYACLISSSIQQIKDDVNFKKTSTTGSQTDLSIESPLDKGKLKVEYKESIKEVQRLHSEIGRIEEQLKHSPTDNGTNTANMNTLMLIQEKEKLLDEIRRLGSIVKNEEEKVHEIKPCFYQRVTSCMYKNVSALHASAQGAVYELYLFFKPPLSVSICVCICLSVHG